jgi:ankyrin repeat protein
MHTIPANEPPASRAIAAIRAGDLAELSRLLEDDPVLATARIVRRRGDTLTLLHVAADWPGHFASGPEVVATLLQAGADVDARYEGPHDQTPLHWVASSDDVGVLDALLDGGADIEAPGAFNGVGGPLDNAVGFGQWNTARRLVERGAQVKLWHAAALGLTDQIEARFAEDPPPTPAEITEAFWQACHGDQRAAAEYLAERGADLNWIGYDDLTPLDNARRSGADELAAWVEARGGTSAAELD